jgi:hypothetical protein
MNTGLGFGFIFFTCLKDRLSFFSFKNACILIAQLLKFRIVSSLDYFAFLIPEQYAIIFRNKLKHSFIIVSKDFEFSLIHKLSAF